MEADAFRRLYPLQYIERYLDANVRTDGRPLGRARPTDISLGGSDV
jgi:exosome complex component RRP43